MKRYLSLILAILTILSAVSAVSISAEENYNELFGLPEIKEGCSRYFLLMPETWAWDTSVTAGIYWDEGSDAPDTWPGYRAYKADAHNVYYYDVPANVEYIIWNNFYESAHISSMLTNYNKRTDYIPTKGNTPQISYNGMIAVVQDFEFEDTLLNYEYPGCDWYSYLGNGECGEIKSPDPKNFYRYYFYLPEKWDNEHTEGVYALWWSENHPDSGYPGDKAKKAYIDGLYYIDLPKDVEVIVWNNAVGYADVEYTFGCSADPFANRNKVFVVDFDKSTTPQVTYFGDWYYYYGNGEYGLTENKTEEFYTCRSFGGDNPAPKLSTNRYYFYAPNDWENKFSKDVGIYWSKGTNNCEFLHPGYKAKKTDVDGIFYFEVPTDVTKISWNNFILAGNEDASIEEKSLYRKTANINSAGYKPNENELYPDGIESFDNMIYVIDYNKNKDKLRGEWYYYYGNGEYGTTPEKGDVVYTQRYFGPTPIAQGDVNFDGKLNVKDATAIQKHLALTLVLPIERRDYADFNYDGKVTIQDATAIQKHIAKIK